jgi:hypothetical protein
MAKVAGVSPATVQRIWDAHGLQPHRVETFQLSRNPKFVEKLTDEEDSYRHIALGDAVQGGRMVPDVLEAAFLDRLVLSTPEPGSARKFPNLVEQGLGAGEVKKDR